VNGCLSPELFTNRWVVNSVIVTYAVSVVMLNVFYIYSAVIIKRMDRPMSTSTSSYRHVIQKRAFKHLLAVLMVTNVTTFPTVIFPIVLGFLGRKTPATRYMVTHIQSLNSMINPLLYTAHIVEIRTAVKTRLFSCRRSISDNTLSTCVEDQPDKIPNISTTCSSSVIDLNHSAENKFL
jgi:hypothetical protein